MKKRTILWIVSIVTVIGLCVGIASYTRWLYGSVVVEEFSFTATQMKSLKKIENYDSLHKDTALVLTFSQKYPPSLYYHSFYSHLDMSQFPQKYSLAMSDQLSDVYDLILPGQTYNIKVTLEVPNPDMKYLPHMEGNENEIDFKQILENPVLYQKYVRISGISLTDSVVNRDPS